MGTVIYGSARTEPLANTRGKLQHPIYGIGGKDLLSLPTKELPAPNDLAQDVGPVPIGALGSVKPVLAHPMPCNDRNPSDLLCQAKVTSTYSEPVFKGFHCFAVRTEV